MIQKKIIFILLIMLLISIAVIIQFIIRENDIKNSVMLIKFNISENPEKALIPEANITIVINPVKNDSFYSIIQSIVNAHKYDINKYNCWNYATDLKNALKKEGYNATLIAGMFNYSYAHVWVQLDLPDNTSFWIDAVDGNIIDKANPLYKNSGTIAVDKKQ
jgi:hypothetical protein